MSPEGLHSYRGAAGGVHSVPPGVMGEVLYAYFLVTCIMLCQTLRPIQVCRGDFRGLSIHSLSTYTYHNYMYM
jgi:hypothetical protein